MVAGGSVTYSLVVANAGPSDAADLSVTDTLPAGVTFVSATGTGWTCTNAGNVSVTCTRPTLATGATAPAITVVVTAPAQAATLTNTATVSVDDGRPERREQHLDASSTTVTALGGPVDREDRPGDGDGRGHGHVLARRGERRPVGRGRPRRCTDTLPAGVTFVSATGTGWVVHERRRTCR